jgi:hypothetical protein
MTTRAIRHLDQLEPTRSDLDAIEAEWPFIAAELAVLDAEIAALQCGEESSELTRRRLRRAQAQRVREMPLIAREIDPLGGVA